MPSFAMLFSFLLLTQIFGKVDAQETDYKKYHEKSLTAEKLMVDENFGEALSIYSDLSHSYDFLFRRDCKIAAQLALFLDDEDLSFDFLRRGVLAGWEMKEIKKTDFLKKLQGSPQWTAFEKDFIKLHQDYESSLNQELRSRMKKMFSKDQKKAFGALFRLGSKGQDKYAEKKFSPHSEQQMQEIREILINFGYPGEKLIGNDFWASTILSHHNSISEAYNEKDTIYPQLKPELRNALERGEVSPFELVLIDEWRKSTLAQGPYVGYGILDPPSESTLEETDKLRADFFLRSVETRNGLIDIQNKTQMDFYLPGEGWIDGKIEVVPD